MFVQKLSLMMMIVSLIIDKLKLSSWCLVVVERLFLTMSRGRVRFVIVVFPDHTHLLFLRRKFDLSIPKTYLSILFILFVRLVEFVDLMCPNTSRCHAI